MKPNKAVLVGVPVLVLLMATAGVAFQRGHRAVAVYVSLAAVTLAVALFLTWKWRLDI